MWQIFKIFWRAEGTRPWLVLVCLIIGSFAEAIGIGAMLPVLGTVLGDTSQATGILNQITSQVLGWFGLSPSLGNLILLVLAFMTVRSLILFGTMTFAGVTGARVTINLRRKLVRALFNANWSYYAKQSSGRIANSLGGDAQLAGLAYTSSATAVTMFVQIIGYAVVSFMINWRVALFGLAAGLLLSLVSNRLVRISRRAGYKQVDRVSAFAADTTGMLQNIKALKAMDRFDAPIDNLALLLKKLKRILYVQSISKYALSYGNDLIVTAIVCAGTWFAVGYANVPPSELLVFGVLFFQVISYVTKFLKQMQSATLSEAGYTRTLQLIDETTCAEEKNTGTVEPNISKGCRFDNVSFAYGEKPVVKNASFHIPAGKITVLEGPSGSGKTTLIDLLIGFHKADAGEIFIGNSPVTQVDLKRWRNSIGYVPQELMLFHDDIKSNITLYDTTVSDTDVQRAMKLAGVTDFTEALPEGVDTDVGEWGTRLSGGQRQRIALARALVRKPQLLILDEVTSALDPTTEAAIVENISRLRGDYTIIVVTHRPAWTSIADNLLKVDSGTVRTMNKKTRKS
jgi:ATP-binding cassette, subfamily C, bacterial